MRTSQQLIDQLQSGLTKKPAHSSALPTAAGPAVSEPESGYGSHEQGTANTVDQIDAINRVFAELELAYHNQFHKAFASEQNEQMAKQLWFDTLRGFSAAVILDACRAAIAESEYLPSLHKLHFHCTRQMARFGLPDTLSAYQEACNAPSPKANFAWSHPAVYYAGVASGWQMLSGEPQARMLPLFEQHYQRLCERVMQGETLPNPEQVRLPRQSDRPPLSGEQNQRRLAELRAQLKL